MTGLFDLWNQSVAQVAQRLPERRCYLLIDAAQLPFNVMPWKEMLQDGRVDNLLHGQPEGASPEVSALLVDYAAAWVNALLARHLARRPFAFIAIFSHLERSAMARALSARTHARLPNAKAGLLRFYDAAVLQSLVAVLGERERKMLLAPGDGWVFVQRDGTIQALNCTAKASCVAQSIRLADSDLVALQHCGYADRIAANLRKNGRLMADADPFQAHRKITTMAALLSSETGLDEGLLYRCSAIVMSGTWGGDSVASLEDTVARHIREPDALCDALVQWVEDLETMPALQVQNG